MPKRGTATNTHRAKATVVESDPVGGSNPGMIMQILETAINRKSVPRNPIYFLESGRPISSICFLIFVTIISSKFCHKYGVLLQ
jgi:hypothetical protein